jgi:hypothetical protein
MTAVDPGALTAGFTQDRRDYHGVLRRTTGTPAWKCSHAHASTYSAVQCAAAELNRRAQGAREVFTLLRCEGCDRWKTDGGGEAACGLCGVPLTRLKLVVLERGPAVPRA